MAGYFYTWLWTAQLQYEFNQVGNVRLISRNCQCPVLFCLHDYQTLVVSDNVSFIANSKFKVLFRTFVKLVCRLFHIFYILQVTVCCSIFLLYVCFTGSRHRLIPAKRKSRVKSFTARSLFLPLFFSAVHIYMYIRLVSRLDCDAVLLHCSCYFKFSIWGYALETVSSKYGDTMSVV